MHMTLSSEEKEAKLRIKRIRDNMIYRGVTRDDVEWLLNRASLSLIYQRTIDEINLRRK